MKRWTGPLIALAMFAMISLPALWWRHGDDTTPSNATRITTGSGSEPLPAPTTPYALLAECRPGNDFDPGTVRVFLANPGPEPVTIKNVLLDGFPLPVWSLAETTANTEDIPIGETHGAANDGAGGEDRAGTPVNVSYTIPNMNSPLRAPEGENRPAPSAATIDASPPPSLAGRLVEHWAYWAKVSDATIPPGGVVEFSAKPHHSLSRPIKLEFDLDGGQRLSALVSPNAPPLRVESVAFSNDRRVMYVYVRNVGSAPLAWRGVSLVERPGVQPDWQSAAELAPGQYGLSMLPLADVQSGDFLTVQVDYGEDRQAIERVRVLAGFPLSAEWGPGNQALGIDPAVYTADFRRPEVAAVAAASFQESQSAMIFECAMHTYAARQDLSARETLRRYDLLRQAASNIPASIHLCRVRPETGYALFAGAADILRFNPNIPNGQSKKGTDGSPESAVASLCWYGYEAARPRPFHTLADTGAFNRQGTTASPEEFRRRTYAAIGTGTRGLLYRFSGQPGPELSGEIVRINREIGPLRSLLAIACPVDWIGWADGPPAVVTESETDFYIKNTLPKERQGDTINMLYSLASGRQAVVVVMVLPNSGSGEGEVREVSLRLPDWFHPGALVQISNGEELDWPYRINSGKNEGPGAGTMPNAPEGTTARDDHVTQAGRVLMFSVPATPYTGAFLLRNIIPQSDM